MVNKERFRELLGEKAKKLSDKEVAVICDDFYSIGHSLLEWCKRHAEEDLEEIPDEKRND